MEELKRIVLVFALLFSCYDANCSPVEQEEQEGQASYKQCVDMLAKHIEMYVYDSRAENIDQYGEHVKTLSAFVKKAANYTPSTNDAMENLSAAVALELKKKQDACKISSVHMYGPDTDGKLKVFFSGLLEYNDESGEEALDSLKAQLAAIVGKRH